LNNIIEYGIITYAIIPQKINVKPITKEVIDVPKFYNFVTVI